MKLGKKVKRVRGKKWIAKPIPASIPKPQEVPTGIPVEIPVPVEIPRPNQVSQVKHDGVS